MAEDKRFFPGDTSWKAQGFQLLYSILNEIDSSKEWCYVQRHDPCISAAEQNVDECLARLSERCGEETVCDLQNEIQAYVTAYSDASILNGIRAAFQLLYALHHPLEMAQYVQNCWETMRGNAR